MHVIKSQRFFRLIDQPGGGLYRDLSVQDCLFDNCALSMSADPAHRTQVAHSEILRCRSFNSDVGPAALVDVMIEDLRGNDLIICWYSVLRRVRLRGVITSLKVNSIFSPTEESPALQLAFQEDAARFYADTDWALDITEAKLSTFELSGVPTHLTRFDPQRAMIVTRQCALDLAWRPRVAPWNSHWPFVIDLFLEGDEPSILLAAPHGRKRLREGLDDLRQAGLCG